MSSYFDKTLNIKYNESLKFNLMIKIVFNFSISLITILTIGFAFPSVRILFLFYRNTQKLC